MLLPVLFLTSPRDKPPGWHAQAVAGADRSISIISVVEARVISLLRGVQQLKLLPDA